MNTAKGMKLELFSNHDMIVAYFNERLQVLASRIGAIPTPLKDFIYCYFELPLGRRCVLTDFHKQKRTNLAFDAADVRQHGPEALVKEALESLGVPDLKPAYIGGEAEIIAAKNWIKTAARPLSPG